MDGIRIDIYDRDGMIKRGEQIGVAIRETIQPGERFIIDSNGDANSGKSLLALAIAVGYAPGQYSADIYNPKLCADQLLNPADTGNTVCMRNFCRPILSNKKMYDQEIGWFLDSTDSTVLIATNIQRSNDFLAHHDYETLGVHSDYLHMGILCRVVQGEDVMSMLDSFQQSRADIASRTNASQFRRYIQLFFKPDSPVYQKLIEIPGFHKIVQAGAQPAADTASPAKQ